MGDGDRVPTPSWKGYIERGAGLEPPMAANGNEDERVR
jgi:hypothetical protein